MISGFLNENNQLIYFGFYLLSLLFLSEVTLIVLLNKTKLNVIIFASNHIKMIVFLNLITNIFTNKFQFES